MPLFSSLPSSVRNNIHRKLYLSPKNHPLVILKQQIEHFFTKFNNFCIFETPLDPVTSTTNAFDDLLIPIDHPCRSDSDSFYLGNVNEEGGLVLRSQATIYQKQVLKDVLDCSDSSSYFSRNGCVWTCDVFRNDKIDRFHFPIFHQLDCVRVYREICDDNLIIKDMRNTITDLFHFLTNEKRDCPQFHIVWSDEGTVSFPFTRQSLELDLMDKSGQSLEVLGCGIIREELLMDLKHIRSGWAMGLGLDRLAMKLFDIPDIRFLWKEETTSSEEEDNIGRGVSFLHRDASLLLEKKDSLAMIEWIIDYNNSLLGHQSGDPCLKPMLYKIKVISRYDHISSGKDSCLLRFQYKVAYGKEHSIESITLVNSIHSVVVESLLEKVCEMWGSSSACSLR